MSSMEKSWCVYILQCADGTYYTGVTNDMQDRNAFQRHRREIYPGQGTC